MFWFFCVPCKSTITLKFIMLIGLSDVINWPNNYSTFVNNHENVKVHLVISNLSLENYFEIYVFTFDDLQDTLYFIW